MVTEMIRSRAVLDHAKGQPCQLQFDGICCQDPETVVFAHLNGADFGKGMGNKSHDIAGCFACWRCHAAYDLRTHGLHDGELYRILLRATVSTWVILVRDGIIKVPLDKPKERKPATRKPKEQRAPINQRKAAWPKRAFPKRQK